MNDDTCPMCGAGRVKAPFTADIISHLSRYPDAGASVCLASGMSLRDAENLAESLRTAAHP
jgi:hypothetical protein